MNIPKRYTVTAALPYANGPLHIGHMAGVYIPADIYVRYLRLRKRDVVFVCGSDEHGAAITLKARKEGKTPQEIVDEFHAINKQSFAAFGIQFDIYHRTSSLLHHKTAQAFFTTLLNKGAFDVRRSEQYFDAEANQFLADRYIVGTCPKCSFENAYGDQCENCGSTLNPQDLINPRSTISGSKPVLRSTSHWFLPMERHENWLREWIEKGTLDGAVLHNPAEWKKQVLGQCKSWIDGGLQGRAMTRDLDWGVPVPLDDAKGKVLYVWLDAPIGYISATIAWAADSGKDWQPYWSANDTKLVHFLAKDNIVFHCIIFPILLKEHGSYILPDNVPANEFLNLEGRKISTSRNWAVWLNEYLEDFPGKEDELRYVLNSIAPEFRDSEFTWSDYQSRVNNELVAILGNFINRTMVLTHKLFGGVVPSRSGVDISELHASDVLGALVASRDEVGQFIEQYRFRDAQQAMMNLARMCNKLLTETEPWKLVNSEPVKAGAVINICLQVAGNLSTIAEPFLPKTCEKLRFMLNIESMDWDASGNPDLMVEGSAIKEATLLYQRIEDEQMEIQLAKLRASETLNTTSKNILHMPQKDSIAFDDFSKIDIRIATILTAERVPKTDKLMKLTLDTGLDQRTVVSGIAEHYSPEDLPGRQVSILMNLEPRKIKGIESQGMILMAEDADGRLTFVCPDGNTGNGATVR